MFPTQDSLQAPPAPTLAPTFDPNLVGIAPIDEMDLSLYADHLAEIFEFDAAAARLAEIAWYQERVGHEVCSLMQAAALRELTIAVCENFVANVRIALGDGSGGEAPLITDWVKDQGRRTDRLVDRALAEVDRHAGAKDDAAHRSRRARFFAGLPGRRLVPVVEAAVDADFDRRSERWWAEREDDVPASLLGDDDAPLIDADDLREVWGVTATGVFWLACLGAGLWALARWVVLRGN